MNRFAFPYVTTLSLACMAALAAPERVHARDVNPLDPLDWTQEQEITADDGASDNQFGRAVALHGATAMVGSIQAWIGGNQDQGAVYVFNRSGSKWTQGQKLVADDGAEFDTFGNSVAFDATTAFVGAYGATVDTTMFRGAAYIFTKSNDVWSQVQKLTADDGQEFDNFGYSAAFNGTTAFLGADGATIGANTGQGAVYVFEQSGGTWMRTQKLVGSDSGTGDIFGYSIAVDGTTAVVGAYANNSYQGAVYVFTNSGGTWTEAQKLTADDGTPNSYFGYSVAISGTTIAVGAWGTNVNGNDTQGAAYVFTESGGTWSQVKKLVADDGAPFDNFGRAVALDATHVLVGADGVAGSAGAVYVFEGGGDTWTQSQELFASDSGTNQEFGSTLTLDGARALSGSWGWNFNQGSAYFFSSAADTDTIFAYGFDGAMP